MEVSRRAGKPLFISRLPGAAEAQLGAGFLQASLGGGGGACRDRQGRLQGACPACLDARQLSVLVQGCPACLCEQSADSSSPAGFPLQGDVSLLGALAAEVLLPGLRVGVPEDLAAQPAGAAPASAAKAASPAGEGGALAAQPPGMHGAVACSGDLGVALAASVSARA